MNSESEAMKKLQQLQEDVGEPRRTSEFQKPFLDYLKELDSLEKLNEVREAVKNIFLDSPPSPTMSKSLALMRYNMKIKEIPKAVRKYFSLLFQYALFTRNPLKSLNTDVTKPEALVGRQEYIDDIDRHLTQALFTSGRFIGNTLAFWTQDDFVNAVKSARSILDEVLEGSVRTEFGLLDVFTEDDKYIRVAEFCHTITNASKTRADNLWDNTLNTILQTYRIPLEKKNATFVDNQHRINLESLWNSHDTTIENIAQEILVAEVPDTILGDDFLKRRLGHLISLYVKLFLWYPVVSKPPELGVVPRGFTTRLQQKHHKLFEGSGEIVYLLGIYPCNEKYENFKDIQFEVLPAPSTGAKWKVTPPNPSLY